MIGNHWPELGRLLEITAESQSILDLHHPTYLATERELGIN